MASTKSTKAIKQPLPKVGDWVLMGADDPATWWLSRVEWAGGDEVLVRDTAGWHPTHGPMLMSRETFIVFGAEELCRKAWKAGRDAKRGQIEDLCNANVRLRQVQERILELCREAVASVITEVG